MISLPAFSYHLIVLPNCYYVILFHLLSFSDFPPSVPQHVTQWITNDCLFNGTRCAYTSVIVIQGVVNNWRQARANSCVFFRSFIYSDERCGYAVTKFGIVSSCYFIEASGFSLRMKFGWVYSLSFIYQRV